SLRNRVFSRKSTKAAAAEELQRALADEQAAVSKLAQVLAEPAGHALKTLLTREATAAGRARPPGEVWQDYEQNAAQLLAILAEVSDEGDDPASRGFLPMDIIEKVQAMSLDLTMLKASLRGYQAFGAKYALVQRRT